MYCINNISRSTSSIVQPIFLDKKTCTQTRSPVVGLQVECMRDPMHALYVLLLLILSSWEEDQRSIGSNLDGDINRLCWCGKMQLTSIIIIMNTSYKTSHLPNAPLHAIPIWILAVPMCRFVVFSNPCEPHVNCILKQLLTTWRFPYDPIMGAYWSIVTSQALDRTPWWFEKKSKLQGSWFGNHYRLPSSYHYYPCLAWHGHGWIE